MCVKDQEMSGGKGQMGEQRSGGGGATILCPFARRSFPFIIKQQIGALFLIEIHSYSRSFDRQVEGFSLRVEAHGDLFVLWVWFGLVRGVEGSVKGLEGLVVHSRVFNCLMLWVCLF